MAGPHNIHPLRADRLRSTAQGAAAEISEQVSERGYTWNLVPGDWTCPVCRRPKPDLVRGPETAKLLTEHHDHIEQFVAQVARQQLSNAGEEIGSDLGRFLNQKIGGFVRRFDRTLICGDCNNADPIAKDIGGLGEFFSFSPREISTFVITSPNKKHEIDRRVVDQLAPKLIVDYRYRCELAEVLVKRAIAGRIWGEEAVGPSRDHYAFAKRHHLHANILSDEELEKLWVSIPNQDIDLVRRRLQKKLRKRREALLDDQDDE